MVEKFKPLGDRVLVKRLESQARTESGLYIPETAKEKPQVGAVIAVGEGRLDNTGKRVPLQVKVGDKICFGKYAGTEVLNQDHLIIREEEILGIVE